MELQFKKYSVIPGFYPTFAFSFVYLSLIVLIPLGGLILKTANIGWFEFWAIITDPRTFAALTVSLTTSLIAATINAFFGIIVAWVLIRYKFPGQKLMDAIVDLPFALPTAVAGVALAALYSPQGWLGRWLDIVGIKVAYTQAGITVALILVGLPFVVRTIQPVLQDLDKEIEEAAVTLGASRFQTIMRVVMPSLMPALLTGFSLAFARGFGEYGSVIFIAGNIPYVSEIAPLLIVVRLEEFDINGATAIAVVMLAISFFLLFFINLIQVFSRKRFADG